MTITDFLDPSGWLAPDAGPRYVQLSKRLRDGVEDGLLVPGSPLPPEREIASITELSRVTVRKAIRSLAEDGIVVQRRGSGSFVAVEMARIEQPLTRLTSFTEDMAQRGRIATSRWLERGLFMPRPDEIAALDLPADASVSRIARLRIADGEPMAIERASLPTDILPNPLEVETSLYVVLERHGQRPVRAIQKISAVATPEPEAAILGVPCGAAALRIERTSYLEDGRAAEFTLSLYRGDAYDFVAELGFSHDR